MDSFYAINKILPAFEQYYTIKKEEITPPFCAEAEFRSHNEQYFLVRSAHIADIDSNEFVYFAAADSLDSSKLEELVKAAWNAGLAKGRENNIFDINDGKDLILTVSKDSNNKTVIQVTDDDERSPLSENYEQACAWISDPKEWNTVYVAKPYDYTSIIVCGGIPVWDNEKHGWVDKTQRNAEKETAEQKDISENYTEQTKDYSNFEEYEPLKF
jgi:hypothetical protein